MAITDKLISAWNFDEASGNAADSVGPNTLTNFNTVAYSAGKINNGADFVTANSEYFTSPSLTIPAAFSISFWFKATTGAQYDVLFNHPLTNGTNTILIAYVGDNKIRYSNFVTDIASSTTFTNGTWTHIVVTSDGSNTGKIYQNGTEVASGTVNHSSGTGVLNVGRRGDVPGQYFGGSLDATQLFGRALTSTEVTALYNSTVGLQYPLTSNAYYVYADGGDACIYASSGASWVAARDAASGTVRTGNYIQSTLSGATRFIERTFMTFDTSSLPDGATITSANLNVYITSIANDNSPSYRLYNSTHTDTIVGGDYDLVGTTEQSDTYLTSPTATMMISYPLNAAGLASINKTGYTKFSIREAAYDVANSQPGGSNVLQIGDSSGVGKPFIDITYTVASGPANLKTYNTNATANIKSINTNAIANVKSLNTNT